MNISLEYSMRKLCRIAIAQVTATFMLIFDDHVLRVFPLRLFPMYNQLRAGVLFLAHSANTKVQRNT